MALFSALLMRCKWSQTWRNLCHCKEHPCSEAESERPRQVTLFLWWITARALSSIDKHFWSIVSSNFFDRLEWRLYLLNNKRRRRKQQTRLADNVSLKQSKNRRERKRTSRFHSRHCSNKSKGIRFQSLLTYHFIDTYSVETSDENKMLLFLIEMNHRVWFLPTNERERNISLLGAILFQWWSSTRPDR